MDDLDNGYTKRMVMGNYDRDMLKRQNQQNLDLNRSMVQGGQSSGNIGFNNSRMYARDSKRFENMNRSYEKNSNPSTISLYRDGQEDYTNASRYNNASGNNRW